MINWLIQSVTAHPDLARGLAPAGLLSEAEQAWLAALKTEKRRRDWLIGRWTAKHLLQSYIEQQTGVQPPLNTLIVAKDPDGAPRAIVDSLTPPLPAWERGPGGEGALSALSLSISHCHDRAFCALTALPHTRIGADIEHIEPRAWEFVEDYFTREEIAAVRGTLPAGRDMLVTAIWSAKEAALKTLRLGLSVDTRSVACAICPAADASHWNSFKITCNARLLNRGHAPAMVGWWRTMNDDVLTLVMEQSGVHEWTVSPCHLIRRDECDQSSRERVGLGEGHPPQNPSPTDFAHTQEL